MPREIKSYAEAVRLAMNSEKEAMTFYQSAAGNTDDERGRKMFLELVAFEKDHFERLAGLLKSAKDGPAGGPVAMDAGPDVQSGCVPDATKGLKGDIDAVSTAIGAEKTARADYLALAESAKDKSVKDFFKKIADEEDGHRRILEDQFLTLTNSGRWTWAE